MRVENKIYELLINVKMLERDIARAASKTYSSPTLRSNAQTIVHKRIQNIKKRRATVTKGGLFRRNVQLDRFSSEQVKNINHHIRLANAMVQNWWVKSKRS